MYEVGTIKMTWTENGRLNSMMYNSVDEALADAEGKENRLLMRLVSVQGDNYSWELLPYGSYGVAKAGMIVNNNMLIRLTLSFLLVYGIYSLYSDIRKKYR
jgi:hypothetical protein